MLLATGGRLPALRLRADARGRLHLNSADRARARGVALRAASHCARARHGAQGGGGRRLNQFLMQLHRLGLFLARRTCLLQI
eukprot:3564642-Prymnesium_polylepis.1